MTFSSMAAPLTSDFETIDTDTNAANTIGCGGVGVGCIFIPPDSNAAVGGDFVVVVTNVSVRFHNQDGTLLHDEALADFFSSLAPTTYTFDPKVLYDHYAERFVIVTLEYDDVTDESRIYMAVSDDADPNGDWYAISINSLVTIDGNAGALDYPGFAYDEEAIYINGDMFEIASPFDYQGVRLWILDKGESGGWYAGGTAIVNGPYDPLTAVAAVDVTTQPAIMRTNPEDFYGPSGADVGTFLVSYSGLFDSMTGNELVQVVRVDDPLGTPTFVHEFVSAGNLETSTADLPDAPQMGSGTGIHVGDRRAINAVWRDGQLYLAAAIDPASGGDAGESTAHWWNLDTSTLSTAMSASTSLTDQGSIGGEDIATDTHTFYPAVDVNATGEMIVGFSASAPTIYPGSYYAVREQGDAAGTIGSSTTLRAGTDWYVRTLDPSIGALNRWGDYSAATVDEASQCFWIYNQHAITRGTPTNNPSEDGRWRTAAGRVCVDCDVAVTIVNPTAALEQYRASTITATGTADVSGTGNLVLEGQVVMFENDFSVASGGEMTVSHFCPLP